MMVGVSVAQTVSYLAGEEVQAFVETQYGEETKIKFVDWAQYVISQQGNEESLKLERINRYINKQFEFKDDWDIWKQEDYWATPIEALSKGGADCEDYVIAKYFSLLQAGVDESKLRITYVKALELNQAHMVLAYYANPRGEPLILDNLIDEIQPARQRRDLSPVYSFNASGMWLERVQGNSIKVGDPNRLNSWTDLLIRMRSQGLSPWFAPNRHQGQ